MMNAAPIALVPELANEQHYEVPAAFFTHVMGEHLKYSSCYWPDGVSSITEAEAAALAMTCERAEIEDGMQVLDMGCGDGTMTRFLAGAVGPDGELIAIDVDDGAGGRTTNFPGTMAEAFSCIAQLGTDGVRSPSGSGFSPRCARASWRRPRPSVAR